MFTNEILSQVLFGNLEGKIIGHETEKFLSVGDNYGSQMLSLIIKIETWTKEIKIVRAVVKIPPPGEFLREMFNVRITFKNEIDFYQTIIPELEKFSKQQNMYDFLDCFPKFLGARSTENVDDSILILENLKTQNFTMGDRMKGFNLATTKIVLKTLAKFHAVPLALKMLQPEVFENKIRQPFFQPFVTWEVKDAEELLPAKNRILMESLDSIKNFTPKVIQALKNSKIVITKNSAELFQEPLATIIHTDAWVNNFMLNFENNSCKLIDFQLCEYGSPLRDFIFFIFSSVETEVIRNRYEELFKYYYENFVNFLQLLGCKTEIFTIDLFRRELERVVKQVEFAHLIVMLDPIFSTKEEVKELEEFKEEDLTTPREVSREHKDRMEFIVQEFLKRNWI